jgi:hypothetical protein
MALQQEVYKDNRRISLENGLRERRLWLLKRYTLSVLCVVADEHKAASRSKTNTKASADLSSMRYITHTKYQELWYLCLLEKQRFAGNL